MFGPVRRRGKKSSSSVHLVIYPKDNLIRVSRLIKYFNYKDNASSE